MRLRKLFFVLIFFSFLATGVHAQGDSGFLTAPDIERLKGVKALLGGIDKKSLQASIRELEKTRHPHTNLVMREAMARTFTDIVKEVNVEGQKKKEWLYSMICLNMAYLQFGGSQGKRGSTSELNRLIRRKLKEYLPPDLFHQSGFLYSLE